MARRVVTLRAFDRELEAWKRAAGEAGLSAWARLALNTAAGLQPEGQTKPAEKPNANPAA